MENFPLEHPNDYSDVKTIAERAGVELQGEEGHPFCCGERMHTKAGLWGVDYAKCEKCKKMIVNCASPHINGGIVFTDEVYEKWGDAMWTFFEGNKV